MSTPTLAASSSSDPPLPALPPPLTPILLYIGAGFDLSPLLTFAPGGPPYPIQPLNGPTTTPPTLGYTYSSFVFVDAKPRHTFACMVEDFEEWKTVDSRVTNIIHYAQGMLNRWHTVPGCPDLIIFEGGGTRAQVQERLDDPAWHFASSSMKKKKKRTAMGVLTRRRARGCDTDTKGECMQKKKKSTNRVNPTVILDHFDRKNEPRPLTTLYYLFNTLDVEIMQTPRMELIWEHVEALYVHGLKIHPCTGRGLYNMINSNRISPPRSTCSKPQLDDPLPLSKSLKRCFVLPGSWSGPSGVRHVDFVHQACERLLCPVSQQHEATVSSLPTPRHPYPSQCLPLTNICLPQLRRPSNPFPSVQTEMSEDARTDSSISPSPSSSLSSLSLTPITFAKFSYLRRPSAGKGRRQGHFDDVDWVVSYFDDDSESHWTTPPTSPSPCSSRSSLVPEPNSAFDSDTFVPPITEPPGFHIPIPQISYSSRLSRSIPTVTMRDERHSTKCLRKNAKVKGRYFVVRSVMECIQVVRVREKGLVKSGNDDV